MAQYGMANVLMNEQTVAAIRNETRGDSGLGMNGWLAQWGQELRSIRISEFDSLTQSKFEEDARPRRHRAAISLLSLS